MEAVRLVVWDLDGVFWNGTLTEGAIEHLDATEAAVIELARRGIVSSICSKNDVSQVGPLLEARGMWRYFVFPSIDWEAKGPRLASLVRAVQLRPETVMFIDDHPMNRAEAAHYVPAMQVESELFLPSMLDDPRFQGKADPELLRLAQYRLLEARKSDEAVAEGDSTAFLRASGITVSVDYDVDANIDRAVELINRTNQLNFTKRRLPEDPAAARAELRALLGQYSVYAGLIKVRDRYGDYGHVGIFVNDGIRTQSNLVHFCFSCRILNMGVEAWVYRWLGCPNLTVADGTVGDVALGSQAVDWITLSNGSTDEAGPSGRTAIVDQLVLRGGCDLGAMSHYLADLAKELHLEVNTQRDDRQVRVDHSSYLTLALDGVGPAARRSLSEIGCAPEDWDSAISRPRPPGCKAVWIFSFWVDSFVHLYRHRELGFLVPFLMPHEPHALSDVTQAPQAELDRLLTTDSHRASYAALQRDYVGAGVASLDEARLRASMRKVAQSAAGEAMVVVMLGPERWQQSATGPVMPRHEEATINRWIRAELGGQPNIHLLDILDFTEPGAVQAEPLHFDRLVYRRAAEHIERLIRRYADQAQPDQNKPGQRAPFSRCAEPWLSRADVERLYPPPA